VLQGLLDALAYGNTPIVRNTLKRAWAKVDLVVFIPFIILLISWGWICQVRRALKITMSN
jgi:hypothetical protein